MWFLFLQIWGWLLIAFILGWFSHWFFCCRGKSKDSIKNQVSIKALFQPNTSVADDGYTTLSADELDENWKPALFATAPEKVDDLKQIKGVGEVLEKTLHDLGVYHFSQIAEWNDEHVAWMDNFLSFTGRIDREDWRSQAKKLAE